MRVFARMGVRAAILTNAAGGINLAYGQAPPGGNQRPYQFAGQNPLVGHEDPRFGSASLTCQRRIPRPTARWRRRRAAAKNRTGRSVYIAVLGPSYETSGREYAAFALWGLSLVGMSTLPEAIVCRQME